MKIIDLTYPITEDMPMYPGTGAPMLRVANNHHDHGFMETHISLFSHTGTHIDAPAHLYVNGLTLDKYPVEHFVGKALVIDCRHLAKGEKIETSLLEEKGQALYEADFVLFLTGHSALWGKPAYFDHFPVMSAEVVEWMIGRRLKWIGIDAPSFDPVATDDAAHPADELPNHKAILKTNYTILLENLCKLEDIGNELFMLYALPLYTGNADGAPARIIAVAQ
jgi:kynurenine formamidase